MKRVTLARATLLLICVFLAASLAACSTTSAHIGFGNKPHHDVGHPPPHAKGGPPPHAPAHGYRAKHTYHYYPDTQVYLDTSSGLYFYLDGGAWRMSANLPIHIGVQIGDYVTIEMDSDKPYKYSKDHKKKYPPGQMKKKKKKKNKKW